jgi:hypothetical protein
MGELSVVRGNEVDNPRCSISGERVEDKEICIEIQSLSSTAWISLRNIREVQDRCASMLEGEVNEESLGEMCEVKYSKRSKSKKCPMCDDWIESYEAVLELGKPHIFIHLECYTSLSDYINEAKEEHQGEVVSRVL